MHESAIAQGVLDAAIAALPPGGARITLLTVSAGVLAGVEEECLAMYLTELSRGTPAEGARLEMKRLPARVVCGECGAGRDYDGSEPVEPRCAACGGANTLEGGRDEIILESLEAVTNEN